MVQQWIKIIGSLTVLGTLSCSSINSPKSPEALLEKKGFKISVAHTSFFEPKKNGWTPVYSFKPISIDYQPQNEMIVIDRLNAPDTLHLMEYQEKEVKGVVANYGDFELAGAYEDYNMPPEFTYLMYINPKTKDFLQIDRLTIDPKGTQQYRGAIFYLQDSINYLKDNRLFLQ